MNQSHSHSPPLPNLQGLSISPPYTSSAGDYRYNGVFSPPNQNTWVSPSGKRGSRSGIPSGWLDSPPEFDYRQDTSSPPISTSSQTSGQYYPPPPIHYEPNFSSMGPPYPPSMGMSTSGSAPSLSYHPPSLPAYGSQSLASIQSHIHGPPPTQQQQQQHQQRWRVDEDVIPTAIVIKNIPFAISRETLLSIIESLGAPLPYAFNYHHDNGIFRGLAFANFRAPEEAAGVVAALNGYDVQGRKLRVEYKKVLQAGEKERIERDKAIKRMRSIQFDKERERDISIEITRDMSGMNGLGGGRNRDSYIEREKEDSPPHSASSVTSDSLPISLDLNDPTALDIYSRVLVFQQDRMRDELSFAKSLTPIERRIVHLVAAKLGLSAITQTLGEDHKQVIVTRDRPTSSSSTNNSTSTSYLSPYASTQSDISPSLRIKKSMPDLRGFNGPVVSRDPARSLTPQRSQGNLRDREYVSVGASTGRRMNSHTNTNSSSHNFGAGINIPPVPPLPAGYALSHTHSYSQPQIPTLRPSSISSNSGLGGSLGGGVNGYMNGLGGGAGGGGGGGGSNPASSPISTSNSGPSPNPGSVSSTSGPTISMGPPAIPHSVNGNGNATLNTSSINGRISPEESTSQPVRAPRGPSNDSRGFTLRNSVSGILKGSDRMVPSPTFNANGNGNGGGNGMGSFIPPPGGLGNGVERLGGLGMGMGAGGGFGVGGYAEREGRKSGEETMRTRESLDI